MVQPSRPHVIRITHLRDCLGIAYQHVVNTDEPVIVQRYSRQEVALVPLWEWEFLKGIEAAIRAGQRAWEAAQTYHVPPCGDEPGNGAQEVQGISGVGRKRHGLQGTPAPVRASWTA